MIFVRALVIILVAAIGLAIVASNAGTARDSVGAAGKSYDDQTWIVLRSPETGRCYEAVFARMRGGSTRNISGMAEVDCDLVVGTGKAEGIR